MQELADQARANWSAWTYLLVSSTGALPTIAKGHGVTDLTRWRVLSPLYPKTCNKEALKMDIAHLTIRSINARPVVAPLQRPIRTASGDVLEAPLVLADVLTEEGVTGRSYAFAYTPLTLRPIVQFINGIAPELVGKPVTPRARMRQLEQRLKLVGWQGFAGMAAGALDMALWDVLACAAGVPLAVLLGSECHALPAYDSYGILDPKCDLPWLEQSVANGFKAVKIKIGAGDLASDVATVPLPGRRSDQTSG
jgi:mandelate racemase